MLDMLSHRRRPQSGHFMCYLNRTYHVLPALSPILLLKHRFCISLPPQAERRFQQSYLRPSPFAVTPFPVYREHSGLLEGFEGPAMSLPRSVLSQLTFCFLLASAILQLGCGGGSSSPGGGPATITSVSVSGPSNLEA